MSIWWRLIIICSLCHLLVRHAAIKAGYIELYAIKTVTNYIWSQLRSTLKPLGTIVLWYSMGLRGALNWAPLMPKDARTTIGLVVTNFPVWYVSWFHWVVHYATRFDAVVHFWYSNASDNLGVHLPMATLYMDKLPQTHSTPLLYFVFVSAQLTTTLSD